MMATLSTCFFMFLPHDMKSRKTPMLKMKTLNPNFLSLKCQSSPSSPQQNQFTVSYLITNFGFSLETATKLSKTVRFKTSVKPDTVIAILRNFGFSDSQISDIVSKVPSTLTFNPYKRILSKFEFLLSKGASNSDVVEITVRSPRILFTSLDSNIIPTFELVRRFCQSNDEVIQHLLKCRSFFGHTSVVKNVNLLLEHGVTDSNIRFLLLKNPMVLSSYDLRKVLDQVKELGFNDPSNVNFCKALLAKRSLSKSKVSVYKKWGWSDEMVLEALRKRPDCMLSSPEKINKVMRFWVNELGWNSSVLVKRVEIFSYSLENRVIPRACVVSYLISKGLIENNVELSTPYVVNEKKFLEIYVHRFKEERHYLLKLYQEKMDGKKIKENGEASL